MFHSKNLYNEANYEIRQKFIKDGEYIPYKNMNLSSKHMKITNYFLANNQLIVLSELLDKNWKSYFRAIKDWKRNPSKYLGMPKLPKYLKKKEGRISLDDFPLIQFGL